MEKEDEDRSCISPYSCNLTSKRLRVGDEGAGGGLAPVFFFFFLISESGTFNVY
jgi:hypothetical protein